MGNLGSWSKESLALYDFLTAKLSVCAEEDKSNYKKLLSLIEERQYGLVYEEHEEEYDKLKDDRLPVFLECPDKDLVYDEAADYNFLIEGDNLHSLSLLNKIYANRVNVIYIDPPYNTKSSDLTYHDRRIDFTDKFKHSNWLSFMYRRLVLARELLADDGVLFISIDDNEQAQLKLLCDSVFGESNFIGSCVRKVQSRKNSTKLNFSREHEWLLVYAKQISSVRFIGEEKDYSEYGNPDNDPNGDWRSSDPTAKGTEERARFIIKNPYTGQEDLPPKGRVWAFSKQSLEEYIKTGKIKFRKDIQRSRRGFVYKTYKKDLKSSTMGLSSLEYVDTLFMNSCGTKELNDILLDNTFSFPKPLYFIKSVLKKCRKDALVLDFFAGSGTTGQAVLELNKEDGGNRRFILCTNNEAEICERVAYERLKTVITGKRSDGSVYSVGLSANLKYLRCEFADELMLEYCEALVDLDTFGNCKRFKDKLVFILCEADIEVVESMSLEKKQECLLLYYNKTLNIDEGLLDDFRVYGTVIKDIDWSMEFKTGGYINVS